MSELYFGGGLLASTFSFSGFDFKGGAVFVFSSILVLFSNRGNGPVTFGSSAFGGAAGGSWPVFLVPCDNGGKGRGILGNGLGFGCVGNGRQDLFFLVCFNGKGVTTSETTTGACCWFT